MNAREVLEKHIWKTMVGVSVSEIFPTDKDDIVNQILKDLAALLPEKKVFEEAYIAGYQQGHNDTVESCYGHYEEKAEEYVIELKLDKITKIFSVGK